MQLLKRCRGRGGIRLERSCWAALINWLHPRGWKPMWWCIYWSVSGKAEPRFSVQLDRITCKLQRFFPAVFWEGNLQEVNAGEVLWAFCTGADFSHWNVPSRESTIRVQGFQSCLPSAAKRNCRIQGWWSSELETSQTLHGDSLHFSLPAVWANWI